MVRIDPGKATLSAPTELAETIRKALLRNGLFDQDRSIRQVGDMVRFPVEIGPEGDDLDRLFGKIAPEITVLGRGDGTVERRRRRTPLERVKEILSDLDPSLIDRLPDRWERLGDALILRFDPSLKCFERVISSAYARVLGSRMVLADRGGISGELREPCLEVMIGPPDGVMEVVHRENGILYKMDPTKAMFSSGNNYERARALRLTREIPLRRTGGGKDGGEIVVDMFAGIGYFALPLAKGDPGATIVACEKNPSSYRYLMENVSLNALAGRVIPILGDNRRSLPPGVADRIVMGYVGGTVGFTPAALEVLSPKGGMIHLHDTVKVEDGPEKIMERFREFLLQSMPERTSSLISSRRVKWYAPRIEHVVLDILVSSDPSV